VKYSMTRSIARSLCIKDPTRETIRRQNVSHTLYNHSHDIV